MSDTVKLLFGVHAHQPAGNFPKVVRDARDRCYGPFFEVLERHPEFPFAVHISGWLLEFLAKEFPEDVARLARMVERGQAEMFGGGDTEPVLAALPDADRRSQIGALNDRIRRRFGVRPKGAWLTERVWEATIVPSLADSGIEYVAVDDYHFLCAGEPHGRLGGYFSTDEDARRLDLFPISESLRYRFPFAPAGEAVAHLESLARGSAAVYFDDIEKFGIWPETHDWVYGRRWLEDFIEAVGRSPHVQPMRYDEFHRTNRTHGVVYLPTGSYAEMGEWTLPPENAARFAHLIERAKRESTLVADKPYLRGGHWRNFFTRYAESNWMHKRMQSASRRLRALPAHARSATMRADLHLAQANDAYWHGLFGGIYLPHLRRQVYGSLARLEAALDERAPRRPVEWTDIDLDGHDEAILTNRRMLAVVKPHESASVCEFTHFGLAHNFCDALMRRVEHYYDKIRSGPAAAHSDAPASIHDRVAFRTHVTEDDLKPDRYPRHTFMDFWQGGHDADQVRVEYAGGATRGASITATAQMPDASIRKRLKVDTAGLAVRYAISSERGVAGALTVEFNLAMPSCDGPGGAYIDASGAAHGGFDGTLALDACTRLDLVDSELHGSARLQFSQPVALAASPLYTVSQSEAGFEKIMQAATLRATWTVDVQAGGMQTLDVRLMVRA